MKRKNINKLHSLLYEEKDELNFKAFPGTDRNMTREEFADAAARITKPARDAWKQKMPGNPSGTNMRKTDLLH